MNAIVKQSLGSLLGYIEKEEYRGYDPYDGLTSPIFKLPFFNSNKIIRLYAQQLVKRSAFNLRPLLCIKKRLNPVTIGLCVQAYSYLTKTEPQNAMHHISKINFLIDELEKVQSKNFSGMCWGYDFDWEARYAKIPAYAPTVVATGIITNALFECYSLTGNMRALEMCKSAVQFVLNDLNRTVDADGDICFSYSANDKQVVFNASMKGARLLAQVYSVTNDETLKDTARKAVAFVMKHQQASGAWIYSKSEVGGWVDNYHTGYVIDCLDEYLKCTADDAFKPHLKKAVDYYTANFFEADGAPKFYDQKTFPIDCTAAGQSLLTLARFNQLALAEKVAAYMAANMQDAGGYFYFRKYAANTEKISFMRWSNAWMFAGLSYLIYQNQAQLKST
ncbi:MAG TPA: delta-aminolevulinic acid dehydratase [Bacteroidia bacterium]|nr:delta-aminolevulinic acid dehydratase [Bacteroidia bacterium]HNU33211.1 delta-aminolevulinic acid dehydratase [Bacteroidia bacterium]